MAYNLQPLIQTLDHILYPHPHRRPIWILHPTKRPLVESLLTKARFLNDLFENPSSITSHAVGNLENRIRDAAYQAQNVIEFHLADLLISHKNSKTITFTPPDLLQEIQDREFEPVFDKLVDIMDAREMGSGPSSSDLISSREDLNPKNIVVGINKDVILLKGQLIMPHESKLQIIPIVGMGGIGKTTLAQTLYDDRSVVSYFDRRAWITISQSYSEREMLLGLLKCIIGNLSDKMILSDGNDVLGSQLHKQLWGRRYLIVLDDMWNSEAWDCIRDYFPDGNNGSRILVTTREQNVANCVASSENLHHQMKLLDEVESRELLRKQVFADEESNPLELEKIVENIAKDCKGLPLAIHVVGGVLARLEQTQDAWKQVAMDVSSLAKNDEQVSHILSLSYNHLPNYLKPCFLYMGSFPEDRVIKPSRLIRLWMAEGFLKPILGKSLEETGRVYLRELVERNLLSVGQQETRRNVKGYIMHDLLRDLCIRKAQEEKFLYGGIDAINDLNPKEMLQLRLRVHASFNQFTPIIESLGVPHVLCSILLFSAAGFEKVLWLHKYAFGLQLLKVLDMLEAAYAELPREMERLVNLRYLSARISNAYPDTISNLHYLQTLIFNQYLPNSYNGTVKELLDMRQLRNIKFKGVFYSFVLEDGESVNNIVNEELQTLSMVQIDDSFHRILKAIPNLKKLGISSNIKSTIDLSSLSQLQIFKVYRLPRPIPNLIFPPSLKKLTLRSCYFPSEFLSEIGRLPNLYVFKVQYCKLLTDNEGEWKPTEGEFLQLRLLQLEYFRGLKKWIADETHYPRLEHLIITSCFKLEEIPSGIGDIPTLEIIELEGRMIASLFESARKIQEEQIEYGNDTFQLSFGASLGEAWAIREAARVVTKAVETVIVEEVETKVKAEAVKIIAQRAAAVIVEESATYAVVETVNAVEAAIVEVGATKAVAEAVEAVKEKAILEAAAKAVEAAKAAVEEVVKKAVAKAMVKAVAEAMEAEKVKATVAAKVLEAAKVEETVAAKAMEAAEVEVWVAAKAMQAAEVEAKAMVEAVAEAMKAGEMSTFELESAERFEEEQIQFWIRVFRLGVIMEAVAMRAVTKAVEEVKRKVIAEATKVEAVIVEESATNAAVETVEAAMAVILEAGATGAEAVEAVKAAKEAVEKVAIAAMAIAAKAMMAVAAAIAMETAKVEGIGCSESGKAMEAAKVEATVAAMAMEAAKVERQWTQRKWRQQWQQWKWKQRKWRKWWQQQKQPRNNEAEELDANGCGELVKMGNSTLPLPKLLSSHSL